MNSRVDQVKKGEETLPEINPNLSENKAKKGKNSFPWDYMVIGIIALVLGGVLFGIAMDSIIDKNDVIKSAFILAISVCILVFGAYFAGVTLFQYFLNRIRKFTTLVES